MASSRLADKIMRPLQLGSFQKKLGQNNQPSSTPLTAVTPTKLPAQQTGLSKSAMRARGNSFMGPKSTTCSNNNLTPLRTRPAESDMTPTRLAIERGRFSNVTTPIDRASESLEKINEVFRQISVGTFDAVSLIRKPAKSDLDGCYIFCRFVNAFRPAAEQWDTVSLQQWPTMMSFLLHSPNCQKICLEIQQIKKKVLRPHISRVAQATYDGLAVLRDTLMSHLDERTLNVQYKHSSVVRKLVMLALVSVNHLCPQEKDAADAAPEDETARNQAEASAEDVQASEHEMNGLAPRAETAELAEQDDSIVEPCAQPQWMMEQPQVAPAAPMGHSRHNSGCRSQRDSPSLAREEAVAHSISQATKVQESGSMIGGKHDLSEVTAGHQHGRSRQGEALANRYAENDDDDEVGEDEVDFEREQEVAMADEEAEVESSKGSAWPSETSRLTPHQSTYQGAMVVPQQMTTIATAVRQSHDQMQTLMS